MAPPLPARARVLTLGSCFAAVLGRRLAQSRLPVLENPFGTVLNPVSACRLLAAACGQDELDLTERIVPRDGRWFSYDAPSGVSGASPEELARAIEAQLSRVREFVRTADAVVLTMGTAWAWRLDGEVVANCHKQAGSLFEKSLLSVQEIVSAFAEAHSYLIRLNPAIRIVLTVSPVRHPKETIPGSSVSKSTLRLACHHLQEVRGVRYFPAYELLLDDLRDYRFYAPDMLHPSALAEAYIFDKFVAAYLEPEFQQGKAEWEEIDRALAHRSAHPAGEAHQAFLRTLLGRLEGLGARGYEVGDELAAVLAQLTPVALPGNKKKAPLAATPPTRPVLTAPEPVVVIPAEPALSAALVPAPTPPPVRRLPIIPVTPQAAEPAKALPAKAVEPTKELPAQEEDTTDADEQTNADRPRKRRGKRGGRRNKRKGETARLAEAQPDQRAAEGLVSTADTALARPASQPTPPPAAVPVTPSLPQREQARVPEEATPESGAGPGSSPRKPARIKDKSRGGVKKVVLQKVRPERPAEVLPGPAVGSTPVLTAPAEAAAAQTAALPAPAQESGQSRRPGRGRGNRSPGAPTPPVAQSDLFAPVPAAPQPTPTPPEVRAAPHPEPEALPVSSPPTAPATNNNESRAARTPGKGRSKGPVATPVQKATAARQAKKAGVGALLLALGGVAPTEPPRAPGVPALATPPVASPGGSSPVPETKASPAAKPAAAKKTPAVKAAAPAKPASPAKKAAPVKVKVSATPVAPPVEAPVAAPARRPAARGGTGKPRTPKQS